MKITMSKNVQIGDYIYYIEESFDTKERWIGRRPIQYITSNGNKMGCWTISKGANGHDEDIFHTATTRFRVSHYGKRWLAYGQETEEVFNVCWD